VDQRQRYRELLAINRAIASAEEYDAVLRLVVERTASFTNATACLLILEGEDGLARVVRSIGIDPAKAAGVAVPLTERIDRELCLLLGFPSPERFLGVPVIGKKGLRGILAVYWEGTGPVLAAAYDEELLAALADQAAIALDNTDRLRLLRASEGKLANIISSAADAIISVDQAQRIVMFNEGAERTFGWSRDEVLGKPIDLLIPPRFLAAHRQHVRDFGAEHQRARKIKERHSAIFGLRKSGEEFPADAAISKLHDAGDWLYTAVLRDITEQKRIDREQRFLAEVGPVLATSLDYEKTLKKIAELAVREIADLCIIDILGDDQEFRRVEVASRDPSKAWLCELLMHLQLDRRRPHLFRSVLETKRPVLMQIQSAEAIASLAQSEEHLRALRAAEIRSMVAVPLVADGQLLGVMGFVSSAASRVYGPADVRLAEQIAQRAALSIENARLYRLAQRAARARDDVLGVVAHDLRSPLSTILMQATLLRQHGAHSKRGSRDPAEMIQRAATRMNRLVEDLLDVTSMEAGQLCVELAPVPARQVVVDSVQAQHAFAASKSLELRLDVAADLPEVSADRGRLLQVFENLMRNAVKFTKPAGFITVGATRRDAEVLFWVADTGAGIAAKDLPHVFDRFWQARKADRQGAGLGLPIVKGIVEAHGGRVWVDSTPGQGSTFFFTIPIEDRSSEQAARPRPACP
jgi:PAS domain S-box-containing protein